MRGDRFYKNKAILDDKYNGAAHSGNIVNLQGAQSVDLPVVYQFARASTATYVDGGVLRYAAIDEERYEDGVLLIEDESTNVIPNSETIVIGNDGWSRRNSDTVVTEETTIKAPDGIKNCWKCEDTNIAESYTYLKIILDVTEDQYTQSIFIKKGDSVRCRITSFTAVPSVANLAYIDYNFDEDTYSLSTYGGEIGGRELLSDGWVRLWIKPAPYTDLSKLQLLINPNQENFDNSGYTYIAFPQIELPDMSSYIPTTDTAVTRAADIITNTDSYISYFDATTKERVQLKVQDI